VGALFTVLAVIGLSLLVTRVATMALTLTGLSREAARFQARSALTGVGFTTSESEAIVTHPVRRRIVMTLMLIGGAGVVTVLAGVMVSFSGESGGDAARRAAILLGGLFAIVLLSRSRRVDQGLRRPIAWFLRRFTDIEARDYEELLHLGEGHVVMELALREGDWAAGRTVREVDLRSEGIALLGITRPDGTYVAVPRGSTEIGAGDTLIAYGAGDRLAELDERCAGPDGDRAHAAAVARQHGRHDVAAPSG
jgi:hypothetical protein